jgi:hypothetical protein
VWPLSMSDAARFSNASGCEVAFKTCTADSF